MNKGEERSPAVRVESAERQVSAGCAFVEGCVKRALPEV